MSTGTDVDLTRIDPTTQKDPVTGLPVTALSDAEAIARMVRIVIPILEMAARLTATTIDDRAVAILKTFAEDPEFARVLSDLIKSFATPGAAKAAMEAAVQGGAA